MRTTFGAEGEIRGTDVLAGLVALWRETASGSLQFQRSGATAGFDLAAGEIVGASSSDARFDTAAILVRAGKLEASNLERLSASEGMDRAMAALQAGVLTRREWRWGEKIRAVEVLSDLLTWIEGDYTFFRSAAREAGEFRLTIPRLVLELFLRSRDRSLVLHHLGGVDVPLVRDSRFDAEFSTFGLTDDAESVVRLIDGESTAAEIASEAPADSFAVEKLLAALVTLGLVHPAYAIQESDSAASPPPGPAEAPDTTVAEEPSGTDETEPSDAGRDLEVEELEPEVDIEEKDLPAPDDESIEAVAEEPIRSAAEFDDVPLDVPPAAVQPDEDREEAMAPPEEAMSAIPGDLMDPDAAGSTAFDRPLDRTTGVGAFERPQHRSTSPLLWVLVVLAAIVAGVLYWRAHGPAGTEPTAVVPSPVPTGAEAASAVEAVQTPPASSPQIPAAASPAAANPPAPSVAPTLRVPTPVPTPRRTAKSSSAGAARGRRARTDAEGLARPGRARPKDRGRGPERALCGSARARLRGALADPGLVPRSSDRLDVGRLDRIPRTDVLQGPLGPVPHPGGRVPRARRSPRLLFDGAKPSHGGGHTLTGHFLLP